MGKHATDWILKSMLLRARISYITALLEIYKTVIPCAINFLCKRTSMRFGHIHVLQSWHDYAENHTLLNLKIQKRGAQLREVGWSDLAVSSLPPLQQSTAPTCANMSISNTEGMVHCFQKTR